MKSDVDKFKTAVNKRNVRKAEKLLSKINHDQPYMWILEKKEMYPIQYIAYRGFSELLVIYLSKYKDKLNVTKNGMTTLHYAILSSQYDCMKILLSQGIHTEPVMDGENSPFHLAIQHRNLGAVNELLKAEADVHTANSQGETPLQYARRLGAYNIARVLDKHANEELCQQDRQFIYAQVRLNTEQISANKKQVGINTEHISNLESDMEYIKRHLSDYWPGAVTRTPASARYATEAGNRISMATSGYGSEAYLQEADQRDITPSNHGIGTTSQSQNGVRHWTTDSRHSTKSAPRRVARSMTNISYRSNTGAYISKELTHKSMQPRHHNSNELVKRSSSFGAYEPMTTPSMVSPRPDSDEDSQEDDTVERCKRMIKEKYNYFIENLRSDDLSSHLFAKNVLTFSDLESVNKNHATETEKMRLIMGIIFRGNHESLSIFLSKLDDSGHGELVAKICKKSGFQPLMQEPVDRRERLRMSRFKSTPNLPLHEN